MGWTGGENDHPTEQNNSGHAEAVEVAFRPGPDLLRARMSWKSRGSVALRVAGIAGRVRDCRRVVDVVRPPLACQRTGSAAALGSFRQSRKSRRLRRHVSHGGLSRSRERSSPIELPGTWDVPPLRSSACMWNDGSISAGRLDRAACPDSRRTPRVVRVRSRGLSPAQGSRRACRGSNRGRAPRFGRRRL